MYYGAGKLEFQRLPVCAPPENVVRTPFLSPWNKATMCNTSRQMTPGRGKHAVFPSTRCSRPR